MIGLYIIAIICLILNIRSYIIDKRSHQMVIIMSESIDTFKQEILDNIDLYFERVVKPEVIGNEEKIQELQIKISTLEINKKILEEK